MTQTVHILRADLSLPQHAADLLSMLESYAADPMGGASPLSAYCRQHLIDELSRRVQTHAFLAYLGQQAVGLAICFEGFSTFACQPLLNIHDFAIHPDYRGRGLGAQLMEFISAQARQCGFYKITLEVLEGNHAAQALYRASGFAGYQLDPAMGGAIMMQKFLQQTD